MAPSFDKKIRLCFYLIKAQFYAMTGFQEQAWFYGVKMWVKTACTHRVYDKIRRG